MPCNTHGVQCPVAPGNGRAVPVWDSQSTVNIWESFPGFTLAPAMGNRPEWKSAKNGNHEMMAFPPPSLLTKVLIFTLGQENPRSFVMFAALLIIECIFVWMCTDMNYKTCCSIFCIVWAFATPSLSNSFRNLFVAQRTHSCTMDPLGATQRSTETPLHGCNMEPHKDPQRPYGCNMDPLEPTQRPMVVIWTHWGKDRQL